MKRLLGFSFVLASSALMVGFVRPLVVNIEETPKADRWSILEPAQQKKALKTTKDPLARAGISEALEDWDGCVTNARQVSKKSPVRDWAQLLELSCAIRLADPDIKTKNKNVAGILSESLKRAENTPTEDHNKNLEEKKAVAILQGRLILCQYLQKHARWKDLRTELQKAFAVENEYSKADRATLYSLAGEVLVAERQWTDAFSQFQRARDLNPDTTQIDTRIRAILPMVSATVRDQFEAKLKAPPESFTPVNPSTDELEIVNQAESFVNRNDPASAVEALSKLLNKFPGGIRAKWAQDKIFELLNIEIEKSKGPNGPSVIKKKILSAMSEFDSDRQMEWGKALFDMQMYADSASLLKSSADQIAGSSRAAKAYYLAARAYQLANDYSKAKELYQLILKKYSSAAEVADAAIQWGLMDINDNDPSEAITHLEVARSRHLTNQQDLISLFWLYESYKMKKTESGITETSNDLMKRFGLTYYGIIAYQDMKNSLPQYSKNKVKTGKVYLSQQETQSLERAKILLAAGLFNAAADELSVFSNRPLNQDEEQYLVNFYSQGVHHQKVFGILSSLFDDAPDKRSDFLVKKLFPKEFWDLVSDDKMRSELDPLLLLSVMKQESAFDHNAISHSGAVGLLQMIPPTAQDVKAELKSDADVPSALADPATNIKFCAHYLAGLIKKYNGSIPLALAAYNAGPKRINNFINAKGGLVRDTWVDELPWAETSFYVKSILKNYLMYRILYGGLNQLPTPPWANVSGSTPNSTPATTPAMGGTPTAK